MGYPVIMNGDHAEFETQHVSTKPEDRPDWPLPSFDARDWASAFCKTAKTHGHDIDEGWMITWFANALMRGFDEHAARTHTPTTEAVAAPKVHGDVAEALTQAVEYFDDRADVNDGDYGVPSPNREMSLAQLCRDALARL